MQEQPRVVAQRLLNLYRQAHVIVGGWAAVNKALIAESGDPQVMEALEKMPTGKRLATHINNLRNGATPMNTIDPDLLPYGGLLATQEMAVSLTQSEMDELKSALANFEPTPDGLKKIKQLEYVRKFGADWAESIKSALSDDANALSIWENVIRTSKAYQLWDSAKQLTADTLTERNRAQIQADMPEFETYLPMFGDAGNELLTKLRTFMSSAPTKQ